MGNHLNKKGEIVLECPHCKKKIRDRAVARYLAAKGGASKSPAKAAAARANGKLGGRPKSKLRFFEDKYLAKLRKSVDIVKVISEYVPLSKISHRYVGICPFHGEETPSFMVDEGKQIFICLSCEAGGDVFSFLMRYKSISFKEAVERVEGMVKNANANA
jgi:CHC2 zinc finger